MKPLGDGGMDREYGEFPDEISSTAYQQDAVACGGLSVVAAHLPIDGLERPAVIFHFQHGDGTPHQALVLVLDDQQMESLGRLVSKASQSALAAARRARRGK